MMHVVRTFSIMRAYSIKLLAVKEVRKNGKGIIVCIKNYFENGQLEDAYSSSYPLPWIPPWQ